MKSLVMLCLFVFMAFVATLSFGGEAVEVNSRQPEFRVNTSSVLNNRPQYKGENVLDGNLQTAWVEGMAGPGIGEWIQIQFANPWDVAHVGIIPGYAKREYREDAPPFRDLFFENNRIRSATLYLNERIEKQIELYDFRVMQYFVLPNIPLQTFKLRIDEIYPGSRWDDTCISEIRFLGRETASYKALTAEEDVAPFEYEVHNFEVPKDLENFNFYREVEAESDIRLLKWLEARTIVKQVEEKQKYGAEWVIYQMDIKRLYQHKKELLEIFTIVEGPIYSNVLEGLTRAAIVFNDKEIIRFILYALPPEGRKPHEWFGREQQRWLALGTIAYAIPVTFSEVFSEQPAVYTFTAFGCIILGYNWEALVELVEDNIHFPEWLETTSFPAEVRSVKDNIHFLKWLETRTIVKQIGKKQDGSIEVHLYEMDIKKAYQHKRELCAQFKAVGHDTATNILYGLVRTAIAFNDKEMVRFFIYLPGPDAAGSTNRQIILQDIKNAIPITFLQVLFEQPKDIQRSTIEDLFDSPKEDPRAKEWVKIRTKFRPSAPGIIWQFRKEDLTLVNRYNALVDEIHAAFVKDMAH